MFVSLILYSTHSGSESSSSTTDIWEEACLIYSLKITKINIYQASKHINWIINYCSKNLHKQGTLCAIRNSKQTSWRHDYVVINITGSPQKKYHWEGALRLQEADEVVLPVRAHGQPRANVLQHPPMRVELLSQTKAHAQATFSAITNLETGSQAWRSEESRGGEWRT